MKWAYALGLAALTGCSTPAYKDNPEGDAGRTCSGDARCDVQKAPDSGSPRRIEEDAAVDARVDDARVDDARVDAQTFVSPPDAATSVDPAAALIGSYAMHARFYGREKSTGLVRNMHEIYATARIARDDKGALKMTVNTCHDGGFLVTEVGPSSEVRVVIPSRYPVRVLDVNYGDDGTFFTSGGALAVGFVLQSPAGCTPGGKLASAEPWILGGMCQCANSDDELPSTSQDCRVIDSDMDGTPGMKINATGVVNSDDAVRLYDKSQVVNGRVIPSTKRHVANYNKDELFLQLSCSDECPTYEMRPCDISSNATTFMPIEPELGCDDVMRMRQDGLLFPGEMLTFPQGC